MDISGGSFLSPAGGTSVLRVRLSYMTADGLRFKIYRKTLWSKVGIMFGMKRVITGFPNFDDKFIVKGNMADKLVQLLQSSRLGDLIARLSDFILQAQPAVILDGLPPNTNIIQFGTWALPRTIPDTDGLAMLFDLVTETLDQLVLIGSAKKEPPKGIFD